jgi:hypothetical protein
MLDKRRPDLMTTYSKRKTGAGEKSPWLGIVKFLFIVLLVVLFLLLGQSMVRHRFFRGGSLNPNSSLHPQGTLNSLPQKSCVI